MILPVKKFTRGVVAILPPRLFASAGYYALMNRYGRVVVDASMRYDKRQKAVHRFAIAIADRSGSPVQLTVPVSRPAGAFAAGDLRWDAVTVSAHGRWWETLPETLATAYGRSPFFEYYIDRLMPVFREPPGESITALDARADAIVRSILSLDTEVLDAVPRDASEVHDFRRTPLPDAVQPYWQIHPCAAPLSILDLIFNAGPESILSLR